MGHSRAALGKEHRERIGCTGFGSVASTHEHGWPEFRRTYLTWSLGPRDAMRGTMFSRRHAEGRNDIRKVGTTVPVKNVRVKVRFSPAVVDDLVGED